MHTSCLGECFECLCTYCFCLLCSRFLFFVFLLIFLCLVMPLFVKACNELLTNTEVLQ